MTGRIPRRRFLLAGIGGIGVVGALAAAGYGYAGTDRQRTPTPEPTRATAEVQRTTLVESYTFGGDVRYAEAPPLLGHLTGTITWLPAEGTVLKAGDVAYRIDNLPIVLMTGETPAYRAMAKGIKGPDVRQLEQSLKKLGYTGFTADDSFDWATEDIVKSWQKKSDIAQTGTVDLGRVIFTAGDVRVGTHKVLVGAPADGTPPYDATSTERRVSFTMDPRHQALAPVGGQVTVVLAGDQETPGTVTAVVKPEEDGGDVTVTATVADQKVLKGGESVDVRLVVRERKDVLVVPIVALLALDGDRYGVEIVDAGTVTLVPVEVGLFADGKVEIRSGAVAEGSHVSVPA